MANDQIYSLIFAVRDLRSSVQLTNDRLKKQEILLEKELKIEEEILKILKNMER